MKCSNGHEGDIRREVGNITCGQCGAAMQDDRQMIGIELPREMTLSLPATPSYKKLLIRGANHQLLAIIEWEENDTGVAPYWKVKLP